MNASRSKNTDNVPHLRFCRDTRGCAVMEIRNVGSGFYGKKKKYAIELEPVTTMSCENPSSSIHLMRCRSQKRSS